MTKLPLLALTALLAGCIVPDPPPMSRTAADPQVHGPSRTPRNLLAKDETTRAIEKQLSLTESTAESAERLQHDTGDMPGMQGGAMPHRQPAPSGPSTAPVSSGNTSTADYYTCVMHPQIHADVPGNCPICGMKLIKKEAD